VTEQLTLVEISVDDDNAFVTGRPTLVEMLMDVMVF
jgi:hypothetical protein